MNEQNNGQVASGRSSVNLSAKVASQAFRPQIAVFLELIAKCYRDKLRFNELAGRSEWYDGRVWQQWTDADDAQMAAFFQTNYGLYSPKMLDSAVRLYFEQRRVNPLTDMLSGLVWDGQPRAERFLMDIMKADDTPANREISRMLFRGGVLRAFEPGCKWDSMVVLIGDQGCGKSTIVDWLGMGYAAEIRTFSGAAAVEGLSGVWIGEVGELSAMRRAKDQEEIKQFISATADRYRKPYDRNPVVLPRRCILIGTTNSHGFLSDQTGSRRFFPVEVHSSGVDLWSRQDEVRNYIRQCWAESVSLYKAGNLPRDYDHSLDGVFEEARSAAAEDDWKLGAIAGFLETKQSGDFTCAVQLWSEACRLPDEQCKRADSIKISDFMNRLPGWHRSPVSKRIPGYGRQRGWVKD